MLQNNTGYLVTKGNIKFLKIFLKGKTTEYSVWKIVFGKLHSFGFIWKIAFKTLVIC